MNGLGIAFYISAIFISISCIIYILIQNRMDKPQKKFYLIMLCIILFNCITELIIHSLVPVKTEYEFTYYVFYICKYLYFISHSAMLLLLGYYVLCVTGNINGFSKIYNIIFVLPVVFIEILLLINPFTHWCFSYDKATCEYTRSWGITLLYVISAFYILFFIVSLFKSWRALNTKRRISLLYFVAMVVVGLLIQAVNINIRVELFAESLAYLGLILTIENEDDLLNTDVGIYNRKALSIDFDNLFANKRDAYALFIKIKDPDITRRITGSSNTDILSKIMYNELIKYVPRYHLYETSPDTFIIILFSKTDEEPKKLIDILNKRFEETFSINNVDFTLNTAFMLAKIPEDISNTEEVFNMADSELPEDSKKILIGKEDLSYLLRRKSIEAAIQRGLSEGNFEVYYQPTFDISGNKFGAEALIRLHDTKLDNVYPDEFIPLAEKIGLISDVDDYVLKTVCEFIASGKLDEVGISSINVNLSVFQCIKPNFVNHIISIVDEYKVDRNKINFEITESINANDYEAMKSVMIQLYCNGFKLYMDDYGTGYSNVYSLFSMNFNVIKIDKSILWGAFESEIGKIILENNVRMLKQMHFKILVEGVETKEQVNLLRELKVDYLQGYYYSRPVPEKDFIELLKKY